MKRKLVFVVPPQVHLLDLCGPAHVFYEAVDEGADFELIFVNMIAGQEKIPSSSGLFLSNLRDFTTVKLDEGDYVFVPGLESTVLLSNRFKNDTSDFRNWMKMQHGYGACMGSVCTGAFVLAEAGVLDGKLCTTHWKFFDRFKAMYPQVLLQSNRLFVAEEKIITSAGVASGIDMALYLIEKMVSPFFAAKIAREVVIYLRRSETDPQLSIFLKHRNHLDDRIHQVQNFLAQHLHEKVSLDQLAELACMSARNLTRLFKATTLITIGEYQQQLRLEKSRQLLREGHKLQAVSKACGLSTSQLRQILNKEEVVLK